MNTSAILEELHQMLSRYFIDTEAHLNDDLFAPPHHSFDWDQGVFFEGKASAYLDTIRAYLKAPYSDRRPDVLILKGGIGNGKTTVLKRIAYHDLRLDKQCMHTATHSCLHRESPEILYLDFLDIPGIQRVSHSGLGSLANHFWQFAQTIFDARIDPGFKDDYVRLLDFWNWCRLQKRLLNNSNIIARHLDSRLPLLNTVRNRLVDPSMDDGFLRDMDAANRSFVREMKPRDMCFYKVLMYKYSLKERSKQCHCRYLFIDNVDHLDPGIQVAAAHFAFQLAPILESKTVIALRPLTWERNFQAQTLTSIEVHCSPDANDVIRRRVELFCKENRSQYRETQNNLVRYMANQLCSGTPHNPIGKLVSQTSGHSIRFALRNFCNLFQSPFITQKVIEAVNADEHVHVSTIVRSFFCSSKSTMTRTAFEDMYRVDGQYLPTMKFRIMDFITRIKKGSCTLQNLLAFTDFFKYDSAQVLRAVQELLSNDRPLIWSNIGYYLPEGRNVDAKLVATPIGYAYTQELFGEVFYDECCCANSANAVDMTEVYQQHVHLSTLDFEEIRIFVNQTSHSVAYGTYYPPMHRSISSMHFSQMIKGLERRLNEMHRAARVSIDLQRIDYITAEVERILNESNY